LGNRFYNTTLQVVSALVGNQTSVVGNQTTVGLTSDQQGQKSFGLKSEIISDQHLQNGVGRKSI
jgi:hypothetical protein